MSYIVPKDKPKACIYCRFLDRIIYECELLKEDYADFKERYKHCPLVEIPPHGRLIDADALANKTFYNPVSAPYITYRAFIDAPTIIETEGSDT